MQLSWIEGFKSDCPTKDLEQHGNILCRESRGPSLYLCDAMQLKLQREKKDIKMKKKIIKNEKKKKEEYRMNTYLGILHALQFLYDQNIS